MNDREKGARRVNYLRVSVTDRCNLRCRYCMPPEGIPLQSHDRILRYEEIERLIRIAASLDISHVRITGGEPLVRLGVPELVSTIAGIPGIEEVSLTTNGILLEEFARPLAKAGLSRINVSLDTLDPGKFATHTRGGNLSAALRGMEAAEREGLTPIKVNVVALRGFNGDEVLDFAHKTLTDGWHVRFIEIMPFGEAADWSATSYLPVTEIREMIEAHFGELCPQKVVGSGPARYWRLGSANGTIGFISPISGGYCATCNRIRLTADGRLVPCLASEDEIDVRSPLRNGATDDELTAHFQAAIDRKPMAQCLGDHTVSPTRKMSRTGG
ncbi:GTP 3',8-cyclase MoaA [Candidatus Bipolaricaulota bacterium]